MEINKVKMDRNTFRGFHQNNEDGHEQIRLHDSETVRGDWVYGWFVHYEDVVDGMDDADYIVVQNLNWEVGAETFQFFTVIPETVGRCTNISDKNNRTVFEGDVLSFTDGMNVTNEGTVRFGIHSYNELGFYIEWDTACYRKEIGFWVFDEGATVTGDAFDTVLS